MDARRFEGKVALVTGGNSGIGLAVAKGLVDEGARVVIVGRNAETVARSARPSSARAAHGVVADTSRLADLDRVIAATREFGGGRLDVVFANAGVGTFGPLARDQRGDVGHDLRHQRQGRLLHGAEGGRADGRGRCDRPQRVGRGEQGQPDRLGLRRDARRRCARSAERSPPSSSSAASASTSSARADRDADLRSHGERSSRSQTIKAAMLARNPMKRFGTTDEVTAAVLFLASDAALVHHRRRPARRRRRRQLLAPGRDRCAARVSARAARVRRRRDASGIAAALADAQQLGDRRDGDDLRRAGRRCRRSPIGQVRRSIALGARRRAPRAGARSVARLVFEPIRPQKREVAAAQDRLGDAQVERVLVGEDEVARAGRCVRDLAPRRCRSRCGGCAPATASRASSPSGKPSSRSVEPVDVDVERRQQRRDRAADVAGAVQLQVKQRRARRPARERRRRRAARTRASPRRRSTGRATGRARTTARCAARSRRAPASARAAVIAFSSRWPPPIVPTRSRRRRRACACRRSRGTEPRAATTSTTTAGRACGEPGAARDRAARDSLMRACGLHRA